MASLTIHALPPLFCYIIRWKDYFGYDEWGFVSSPPLTWDLMLEMWKWGSVFYGSWVVFYVIVMDIILFK